MGSREIRRAGLRALLALGLFGCTTPLFAQPAGGTTSPGTLPPVIVEQAPPATNSGPLPGVSPLPANDFLPDNFNPVDNFPTEPSQYAPLRNQVLGGSSGSVLPGATGVTRGLDMSIFDDPRSATIIDQQNLIEKNVGGDMARALQNEMGILIQSTARGQSSPFLRGLTGQDVVILIDGVRVNNSTYRAGPNQYFNTIDPGMIERIEVVRGAQSVLWGSDAIGGVINVVTKSPDRSREYGERHAHNVFSTADTANYTRFDGQAWANDHGIYAGASYMNVNDLDIGGGRGRQPFTDYDQYAGDFKYQRLLDIDTLFTVSLQHFEQQDLARSDRFLPFVLGPPTNTQRPTFFDPQQRDMVNLRLDGLTNGNVLFDGYSITGNYSRQKEGTVETRLNNNTPAAVVTRREVGEFDVNTFGFVLTLVKDLEEAGKLSYGADYYYDDVDATRVRTFGAGTATPQFPNDSLYDRAGVYAAWDVPLTERLSAVTGVRFENANASGTPTIGNTPTYIDRTYQDWVASIGLNYKVTEAVALVGGYYEGYRAPTLDDLFGDTSFLQGQFQSISSVNIGPQYSETYEVGIKVDGEQFRFQAYQYWNNLNQAILRYPVTNGVFDPNSGTVIRDNSDAYIYGTELGGEYLLDQFYYRGWSLYGNVWYTYGTDLGTSSTGAPSEPFSRIPPLTGTLGIRWRAPENRRWFETYVWAVDRADRYSLLNTTDARFPLGGTPGYATLNVRGGRTFGDADQHRLSIALENLTDKYYRVLGSGVEGAGINGIFGYEYFW
jgi:outer membrane receptor protein involved in Fe transport